MTLDVGEKAPSVTLPVSGGGELALAKLKGKPVVVYFYPKDNTSGCTKEAQDFQAAMPKFKKAGTEVIGISKDSVASHDKFAAKYDLSFPLMSDTEGKACEAFGTWVEKSLYGRKYMGIERTTFLIDAKGVVRKAWRKVKVPGHVDEVLAAVKAL
ncbi:MAG: thioredoxin-dependent thiol peroxidase [Alphaproteobacteria bacterium]|nr:thioredoxin-dependent thiol peroxidase [Alphaproteobacteria bacterium]